MPSTYVQYRGDGSNRNFAVTFPYLARDHVKVTVDEEATAQFVWLTDSMIQLATAPASDALVDLRRQTPRGTPVDFEDGSVLAETDLDLLATYTAYLSEEARDGSEDSLKKNLVGLFDGRGIRVTNVGPGEHPTDAVNKAQLVAQQAVVEPLVETAVQAAASANSAKNASETIAEKFGDVDGAITAAQDAAQSAAAKDASAGQHATNAQQARTGSEAARSIAEGLANMWPNTAAGLANTADSRYFSTPSPLLRELAIIYQRQGSSAVEFKRTSDSEGVNKPVATGRKNGWPDQFFQRSTPGTAFLGRQRWMAQGSVPGYAFSLVPNVVFPTGNALRRTLDNTNLSGPIIYFDELGVTPGDTVTVCGLFVGAAGVAWFPMSVRNGAGVGVGGQINGTTESGAQSLLTNATPQRMHATFVVPEGGSYVWVYPFNAAVGKSFDLAALWAYKGTLADGPVWPTFSETPVLEKLITAQGETIASTISTVVGPVTYAFDSYTNIVADATTVIVEGTDFSTSPRDLPFRGWAEAFTPSGVSFNAVRLRAISRPPGVTAGSRWRKLRVVVRTGSNPSAAGSAVVAVGSVSVDPMKDTLTDVSILLRDPITGALKTLSDASFTGGKYLIGVYAENASGGLAACGEPRGTLPNSAGQSYYTLAADPLATDWFAYSSNLRIGFQHLLLTNPTEVPVYVPTQALKDAVASTTTPTTSAPEIVVPPYIYGVVGRECNVYLDNLHLSASHTLFSHNVDAPGSIGQQQNERFTLTPVAAATSGALSVSVVDRISGSALIATKTAQLRIAAANAGSGLTKNVLVIGDSLVNANVLTQTLLDIADGDAMKVALYGTRGTGANRHEGRGGWSVDDYAGAGRSYRRFTVSGISTIPAINATKYTDGASVWTVQEVAVSGGAGTIDCSLDSGPNTPASSGTLTKSNGSAGDATIAFSASSVVSGNPFYIGGAVNVSQYLANNGFPAMDWVFIALGINDIFGQVSDAGASLAADTALAKLDTLINSIKAANPSTKVALVLPSPPSSDQDAFGANYGTGQTRDRDKRNILIWARQMLSKFMGQEANRVYLVPSNVALDTVNNMNRAAAAPINSRTASTSQRQNNGVHPGFNGYQQIADVWWAFLKFFA